MKRFLILLLLACVWSAPATAQMSEVEFDLLSAKMASALKKGEFEKALPLIAQIKSSGREYTPSLIYFEGFALENLGNLKAAEATYLAYMEKAGKSGAYYKKALSRVVEIQDKIESAATNAVEDAAKKARAAEEAKRKAAEAKAREEAKKTQPGHKFKDCGICPEMVIVPAGSFTMGSTGEEFHAEDNEVPRRQVTIPKKFAIGVLEVTHGEISQFVRETSYAPSTPCKTYKEAALDIFSTWEELPNWPNASYAQTANHPAVCVGYSDAKAYVDWLIKKTGETYRIPTEAEWEYAARAGTTTDYFYGDDKHAKKICSYGNTAGSEYSCTNDGYRGIIAPVGQYKANRFGLKDTIGNVLEWTEDCYFPDYNGAPTDGSARTVGDCQIRAARGGSYFWASYRARSATRYQWSSEYRLEYIGFRVVREVK